MILRYDGTTGEFVDVFASGGALAFPQYLALRETATAPVPVPATLMMLGIGLVALALARRAP
jgi:hypothetical protein